mmetsp:Transcript_15965/g.47308  ORF Transcript_15965/g.47308 Transcript_15965/m.47308 type:complete len:303 (+) Transcript_15965:3183-4091(+)
MLVVVLLVLQRNRGRTKLRNWTGSMMTSKAFVSAFPAVSCLASARQHAAASVRQQPPRRADSQILSQKRLGRERQVSVIVCIELSARRDVRLARGPMAAWLRLARGATAAVAVRVAYAAVLAEAFSGCGTVRQRRHSGRARRQALPASHHSDRPDVGRTRQHKAVRRTAQRVGREGSGRAVAASTLRHVRQSQRHGCHSAPAASASSPVAPAAAVAAVAAVAVAAAAAAAGVSNSVPFVVAPPGVVADHAVRDESGRRGAGRGSGAEEVWGASPRGGVRRNPQDDGGRGFGGLSHMRPRNAA